MKDYTAIEIDEALQHYGVKRRSGRYPWGSGDSPYQHSGDFLSRVEELKKDGNFSWTDPNTGEVFSGKTAIAKSMGLTTTEFNAAYHIALQQRKDIQRDKIQSMRGDGYTWQQIADELGLPNESTARSLANPDSIAKASRTKATADILKTELAAKGLLDVGAGVDAELGISEERLNAALYSLELEGYKVYGIGVSQATDPRHQTTTKVLAPPGTAYKDIYADLSAIQPVGEYHSDDGGLRWDKREYPSSIDSSRVMINYGDQGGLSKDGVIEIRPGVPDLDLGNSHYAQVRIMVDGTHYLKGMAKYSDDLPEGVDIRFNTNKTSEKDKMDVLKKIKDDPDNPFGAYIKASGQSKYTDPVTGEEKLSAINKLKEEGDWQEMNVTLSQQFLSKQPMQLINKQLDLTYKDYEDQYNDILSLENPTLKRKMLMDFADECDSATVHLQAASLPRQSTKVILPVDQLKDNEIYAPGYKDGEHVCLIRYPHGGTFEIPELVVNNKNPHAANSLGNAIDAVGINSKVAERLSGADFDGDTVTVIPVNSKVHVQTRSPLKGLVGFDPKVEYSTEGKTGAKLMTKEMTQKQMGMISNLITDMTLKGATDDELARAVRHSMVVIDAEKHKLDYTQSERDNGIAELKEKYQTHIDLEGKEHKGGAATLLSARKQDVEVPETRGSGRIDPETGEKIFVQTNRTYINKQGKEVAATKKISKMEYVKDARMLSSGTEQENAYADYANKMKALANTARKEYATSKGMKYDPEARKRYSAEVEALNKRLEEAKSQSPRERYAQRIANSVIKAKKQDNPDLKNDKKQLKKISQAAINDARYSVGSHSKETRIVLTDREWEAIMSGAVSDTKAAMIFGYCDQDKLKERAMPKDIRTPSPAKQAKIRAMQASGYTIAQIADAVGFSTTTVSKYL